MLSTYEMEIVINAELILTKNRIIGKVYDMFGSLCEQYVSASQTVLPHQLISTSAKISKGENYLGLPYVMLDYPRNFSKEATFAIRTLFWWGNFFSLTLHASGKYKTALSAKIDTAIKSNKLEGWYLSCGSTEWNHHFESDNYVIIDPATTIIPQTGFIKLATKIPLNEWKIVPLFLQENYYKLLEVIAH